MNSNVQKILVDYILECPAHDHRRTMMLLRLFRVNKGIFARVYNYCMEQIEDRNMINLLYNDRHPIVTGREQLVACRLSLMNTELGTCSDVINVIYDTLFMSLTTITSKKCLETFPNSMTEFKYHVNIFTKFGYLKYVIYIKWLNNQRTYKLIGNNRTLLYDPPCCIVCKSRFGVDDITYKDDNATHTYPCRCAAGCTIRCKSCNYDNIDISLTPLIYEVHVDQKFYNWSYKIDCRNCGICLSYVGGNTYDDLLLNL